MNLADVKARVFVREHVKDAVARDEDELVALLAFVDKDFGLRADHLVLDGEFLPVSVLVHLEFLRRERERAKAQPTRTRDTRARA